ncbi:MAG TPA: hypothetical protein VGD31_01265 [Sphingobacteriaceae bacterium]
MTKNLETADLIVKIVLAVLVISFYFSRVITGPLARILMFLAVILIVIIAFRMAVLVFTRD